MKPRIAFAFLLLSLVPLAADAANRRKALAIDVSARAEAMPLVTLTASNVLLDEVAEGLARKLGITIEVSAAASRLRVTTRIRRQPLDRALRALAPQAYVDGVLAGGTGGTTITAIYLRAAAERPPPLTELEKRRSEFLIFTGDTEDPAADPLAGQLEVTWQNGRLRVLAKSQPLAVVAYRIAEAVGISLETIGDSHEVINVDVADASLEEAMRALPPSLRLYHRRDPATPGVTPVRLVLQASPVGAQR